MFHFAYNEVSDNNNIYVLDGDDKMDLYDELLNKLKLLKKIDINQEIFGAAQHHYHFHPTLSEDAIKAFEQAHKITLPADYHHFLTKIGNGGAGPSFGISPLEKFFTARHYGNIKINDHFLVTPFPYSTAHPFHYTDESDESLIREMTGTLTLCDHGCGYYDMLIISGSEKGTVWSDARCSDQGMEKIFESFLDWYFDWLDTSIETIKNKSV
ncbi:SMI1/KNR4 family protein [Listeria costaricensis]|uniref:SMI1/KNR4 family protein n=1 Tax=Listeria costaricensis TaxID=2026604 RepID=UPI000C083AC0|nr:SMI1/KNR4 family protein [Listeria costaricensis]